MNKPAAEVATPSPVVVEQLGWRASRTVAIAQALGVVLEKLAAPKTK
jgi:hypothetical protein